jgi:hypothetical protein
MNQTSHDFRPVRLRLARWSPLVLCAYPFWLAMMAIHESGHVLHAWLSGGHVQAVHFGWFEFSRTELAVNSHPLLVAWGGPVWGCTLPLLAVLLVPRPKVQLARLLHSFAGFCLVANGAYLGVGAWIDRAGDAGVLVRLGVPQMLVSSIGLLAMTAGLYLWHRLGIARNKGG